MEFFLLMISSIIEGCIWFSILYIHAEQKFRKLVYIFFVFGLSSLVFTKSFGKIFLLIVILLVKKELYSKVHIYNKSRNTLLTMFLLDAILILCLYFVFISERYILSQETILGFSGLCLVVATMMGTLSLRDMEEKSKVILNIELKLKQVDIKLQYYNDMEVMVDRLKSMRHDLNNYTETIQGLMARKEYDELQDFINELSQENNEINNFYMTTNKVLNIILNAKYTIAQQSGIKFNVIVQGAALGISDTEICSLFGNILDNAIRGCSGCAKPEINLEIIKKKNGYKIVCTNSSLNEPIQELGKLKTTKKDAELHGIGSQIVLDIINGAGGTITYDYEDNLFTVSMLLPRKRKND